MQSLQGPTSIFTIKWKWAFFILLIVYLVNGIVYLNAQSITFDEGSFYNYAVRLLKGNPNRIYPDIDHSKMPVSVFNTIPRIIESITSSYIEKNDWGRSDIIKGRHVTLLLSTLTLMIVFKWAKELFGVGAGLFSTFLFVLCPNSIAHAGLVTTDAYSSLFLVTTFYFVWRYNRYNKDRDFYIMAILIGLSQLVKLSLFHLYVLVPICLLITNYYSTNKFTLGLTLIRISQFLLINFFIINLSYYFYHFGLPLGDYRFSSSLFKGVQEFLPNWIPIPFPEPFITGLDQAKYYDQLGGGYEQSSFGNVTILGQSSTGGSFWYYYIVTIFYKTPISYFVFFFISLFLLLRNRKGFFQDAFFLIIPIIYFLIIFSFFYKTQIGLRHVIFIYPFVFIIAGRIVLQVKRYWQYAFVIALSIYLLISVGSYWKNYIPYTNEFIGDKKLAYNKVGADNLQFGQANYFLQTYLFKHPYIKPAPVIKQRGIFYLSVSDYLDIWNRGHYKWLKHLKPVGHIAHAFLIFKVD
jgi:4-amino-4-deoxy-L-arabinose transferase-like glycosyltransferase